MWEQCTSAPAKHNAAASVAPDESDLVVMGAVLRRLDDRPSLGATVESVLRNCDATVVVVVVPVDL